MESKNLNLQNLINSLCFDEKKMRLSTGCYSMSDDCDCATGDCSDCCGPDCGDCDCNS